MIYRLFFILMCIGTTQVGHSQEAGAAKAISTTFSPESIEAYREHAHTKIGDFYQYLQLLSDPTIPPELKKQAKEAVYHLFADQQASVINFAKPEHKISLEQLLKIVEQQTSTTFTITETSDFTGVFLNHWVNRYHLQWDWNGVHQEQYINQTIYFSQEIKNFGDIQKNVWVLRLGEME